MEKSTKSRSWLKADQDVAWEAHAQSRPAIPEAQKLATITPPAHLTLEDQLLFQK